MGKSRKQKVVKEEVVKKGWDPRTRHKCNPQRVFKMAADEAIKEKSEDMVIRTNAVERAAFFKKTGFSPILGISNWKSIPSFFVDWVVNNFDANNLQIMLGNNTALKITEADVARVYNLPMSGIDVDLKGCTQQKIDKLIIELGLDKLRIELGLPQQSNCKRVHIALIEKVLPKLEDNVAWSKAAILYMLGSLLCPINKMEVNLEYAHVLEDLENLSKYNWCKHILQHLCKGIPSKEIMNPKADFHFLMINYLDKMGGNSPILTGQFKIPTCQGWDLKKALNDLENVQDSMRLEYGITHGFTTTISAGASTSCNKVLVDAERCPATDLPEYLKLCIEQITLYTTVLKTVEDRMKREGVWYSDEKKIDLEKNSKRKRGHGSSTENPNKMESSSSRFNGKKQRELTKKSVRRKTNDGITPTMSGFQLIPMQGRTEADQRIVHGDVGNSSKNTPLKSSSRVSISKKSPLAKYLEADRSKAQRSPKNATVKEKSSIKKKSILSSNLNDLPMTTNKLEDSTMDGLLKIAYYLGPQEENKMSEDVEKTEQKKLNDLAEMASIENLSNKAGRCCQNDV